MEKNVKIHSVLLVAIFLVVGYQQYQLYVLGGHVASLISTPAGLTVKQTISAYADYYAESNKSVAGQIESVAPDGFVISAPIADLETYRARNVQDSPIPTVTRKIKVSFDKTTKIEGIGTGTFTPIPKMVVQVGAAESFLDGDITQEPIPIKARFIIVMGSGASQ